MSASAKVSSKKQRKQLAENPNTSVDQAFQINPIMFCITHPPTLFSLMPNMFKTLFYQEMFILKLCPSYIRVPQVFNLLWCDISIWYVSNPIFTVTHFDPIILWHSFSLISFNAALLSFLLFFLISFCFWKCAGLLMIWAPSLSLWTQLLRILSLTVI